MESKTAARVKERREALGWSLRDLADELGFGDKQRVHRVEMGQPIGSHELAMWAEALAVSPTWLLGLSDEEQLDAEVVALMRKARKLDAARRAQLAEGISRLPRRPQARCAARPEVGTDNAAYRKAG